jgi:hypothetical protein
LFYFSVVSPLIAQTDYNKVDEKKMGFERVLSRVRLRYEGTLNMEKKLSFSFYDTKAKSIIATREFNAIDNSAHRFYDQAKNKVSEGK